MAVHALNAEHRVSARTEAALQGYVELPLKRPLEAALHRLDEIHQPVQVELPFALEREAKEVPITDGTNAEATGAEPTPKVLPLPSLDERVEMHLRAVSGSDDATISRSRAAVRERILDAIAGDIVPQILERKKWVEISEPTPSADPLVSRVIGICVVLFRNIFDLGSRVSEFLSSLTPRTLAWAATAAIILVQAAVITALLVKEQRASSGPSLATPGIVEIRMAAAPPTADPAQTAASSAAAFGVPRHSDEEIAALVAGGRQLMIEGDIRNARLVLQQAAEAGNAAAALELGATYDPIELKKLELSRHGPTRVAVDVTSQRIILDIAMARTWYQKAKDLGSTEAENRLKRLAVLPTHR
jgi:hypothetical protein